MNDDSHTSPFNAIPPVVVALFLVIMGFEILLDMGASGMVGGPEAIGWRLAALQMMSFSGDNFDWVLRNGLPTEWSDPQGRFTLETLRSFVTYPFVHGSFTHALFVGVILLAMGKMVAEVFGQIAFLLIFVLSSVGGALAYGILLNDPIKLIGGFPPVYGLIGAFTFLLWRSLGMVGANQTRAFSLIGFLMGFQLLFGLLFGASHDWVADLAGFATGFGLSFFLAPGGWARMRSRIRHE